MSASISDVNRIVRHGLKVKRKCVQANIVVVLKGKNKVVLYLQKEQEEWDT